MITIKIPIWKSRSFGVADFRLEGDGYIEVECDYKGRDGNKIYPYTYTMSKEKARTYPKIKTGKHWGREIPIDDFMRQ